MPLDWTDFQGVNAGYVAELYERFQANPESVDPEVREFLRRSGPPPQEGSAGPVQAGPTVAGSPSVVVGAVNLAQSIRRYGHLAASIDPLGQRPVGDPSIELSTHGVTEADLRALPATLISGPVAAGLASMWDVVERLRTTLLLVTTGYPVRADLRARSAPLASGRR